MNRKGLIATFALTTLLVGSFSHAQAPAGYELALVDVDGTKTVVGQLPPSVYAPRIAPDGKRVAFETRDLTGPDGPRLWTAELSNIAARKALPLVVGQINWAPMWTPDGARLVFIVSSRDRPDAVYWRRADGTGDAEHLIDTRAGEGWLAGGEQLRFLTLKESAGNRDYGIAVLDMSSRTVRPIIDLPDSAQHSSAVSPDGKWMAYASNETGRYEVWVEPLPQTGTRVQVTREGGSHPLWLPDGQALYFDRDHQMFRLPVNTKDMSSRVEPTPLPIKGFAQAEYRRQFDLMPNGRQFLMLFPTTVRAAAATMALPAHGALFQWRRGMAQPAKAKLITNAVADHMRRVGWRQGQFHQQRRRVQSDLRRENTPLREWRRCGNSCLSDAQLAAVSMIASEYNPGVTIAGLDTVSKSPLLEGAQFGLSNVGPGPKPVESLAGNAPLFSVDTMSAPPSRRRSRVMTAFI